MTEPRQIDDAAALLRGGELVAFPTETVYGLGADATNDDAVANIFEAKGRPRFNPLIVHVPSLDAAREWAVFSESTLGACRAFWPGPVTWVLPKRRDCRLSPLVTAGLDTVAVRVPAHPVARRLLEAANLPIAAPSANRSGSVSPTRADHVRDDLGDRVAMILDGGEATYGLESTVIDGTGVTPSILRLGSRTRADLAAHLGEVARAEDDPVGPRSPGQLASHYAPRLPLRINATFVKDTEALLAFGESPIGGALVTINLSPTGDVREAAARLFASLRTLDRSDATAIAAMPIPDHGLGEAINDRLRRASIQPAVTTNAIESSDRGSTSPRLQ